MRDEDDSRAILVFIIVSALACGMVIAGMLVYFIVVVLTG